MVTTRARARAQRAEALATVVHLIMEHLQLADMKFLRLACTSVRQALDRAVDCLKIWDSDLVHLSQASFRPSKLYIAARRGHEDGDGELRAVPPQMAACLQHVFKLNLARCAGSPTLRQALQPCFAQLRVLRLVVAEASATAALVLQMPQLIEMGLHQTELTTEAATALSRVSSLRTLILRYASATQACDVTMLTQLTELQLIGQCVLQGDLQPLSQLQNLRMFCWASKDDDLSMVAGTEGWTEAMIQEARQWSHGVKQAVQQWLAPTWSKLTELRLDVEMDRATLQAIASHCPQLQYLGCSTLSIKESQPQIQLPSLLGLLVTFNLPGAPWYAPNPVPVSAYAALKAPLLEVIITAGPGGHRRYATVLVDPSNPQALRDAEVAATGALRATRQIGLYTGPPGPCQPHPTPAFQALAAWQPSFDKRLPALVHATCDLQPATLKGLPPAVASLTLCHTKYVKQDALDTLAGHAALRELELCPVYPSAVANLRVAILRLLELAQQGSCLTIEVPEVVFSEEQAAEAMQEAARARLRAGVPGGVPALKVEVERN